MKVLIEINEYPFLIKEICNLEYNNHKDYFNFDYLNSEEKFKITKLFKQYEKLLYKEGDTLSFTHEIQHKIDISFDRPIYSKMYKYPQVHELEVDKQIKEMLRQGIIKESNSPYNSPL